MKLDTNNATSDIEPDVILPRDLVEWLAALVESFPKYVATINREGETP